MLNLILFRLRCTQFFGTYYVFNFFQNSTFLVLQPFRDILLVSPLVNLFSNLCHFLRSLLERFQNQNQQLPVHVPVPGPPVGRVRTPRRSEVDRLKDTWVKFQTPRPARQVRTPARFSDSTMTPKLTQRRLNFKP